MNRSQILVCSYCSALSGGAHIAQRQTGARLPIGLCVNFSVSVSVSVSGSVNTPYLVCSE